MRIFDSATRAEDYESDEFDLDKVAVQLCVEPRRIYDIVHILEIISIVVRVAKNKYRWMGLGGPE